MAVKNLIKKYLDELPDPVTGAPKTSAYRFWKQTDLSRSTAYRLYNDPHYIPTGEVLDKLCKAYRVQPGTFLFWTDDDHAEAS